MVARVVQTCTETACTSLLVRGTKISLVSVEHLRALERRRRGPLPRDPEQRTLIGVRSDIRFPAGFVLVHDTEGTVFPRCDVYIVRFRARRVAPESYMSEHHLRTAREYFGDTARIQGGSVDHPSGPWARVAKIQIVRYTRHPRVASEVAKFAGGHEHEYAPPVWLYSSQRPLAWKLSMPSGCIIDERGFVVP